MRRLIDGIARTLAVLAAVCIGLLMMATVVDVGRRTLTGRALPGTVQYSELLMVSLVFAGLAWAQRRKEHVGVNLVTTRLPDALSRALRLSGLLVATAFLGWMAWETAQEALRSWQRGEIRIGLQAVRVWPARALIPLGLAALLLQLAADIVDIARGRLRQSAAAVSGESAAESVAESVAAESAIGPAAGAASAAPGRASTATGGSASGAVPTAREERP